MIVEELQKIRIKQSYIDRNSMRKYFPLEKTIFEMDTRRIVYLDQYLSHKDRMS